MMVHASDPKESSITDRRLISVIICAKALTLSKMIGSSHFITLICGIFFPPICFPLAAKANLK